ncbi:MAG: RNA polymerase-associated protein RapA [Phycisphaerales bacterium]|nr:RNA polymerase-associated protein RapA [Phycisphaerales bacterium]
MVSSRSIARDSMNDAVFAARLRDLRGRLGLTQVKMAELLGTSFASINRWENGQRPSRMAWDLLCRAEERYGAAEGRIAIESGAAASTIPPSVDFLAPAEEVRLVTEAERLSFGHLANPAFATEVSLIDPLPHQRIAVYEHLLRQPRLRFLLADDAGAGKTIMAGLYVREMLARRLIRRVLIIPPAGLVGNWERELRTLFSLDFRIVRGSDMRASNPFVGTDGARVICSVDTLRQDQAFARLQDAAVEPYDLVVFDEAHKLSADREPDLTIRKTDRYRLAEALAGVLHRDGKTPVAAFVLAVCARHHP